MDRVNVLCGASLCSGYIIKKSGIKFDYVCEKNQSRWGNEFEGALIIGYDEIPQLKEKNKVHVYLSNRYATDTMKKINSYGLGENLVVHGFINENFEEKVFNNILEYYNFCGDVKKTIEKITYKNKIDNIENENIKVILYTMGKVGTQSIEKSLNKIYGQEIMITHSMERFKYPWLKPEINKKVPTGMAVDYFRQGTENFEQKKASGEKIKVISVVREPIARNMSAMFFMLPVLLGASSDVPNVKKSENAISEYFEEMFYSMIDEDFVLNWYDNEIKKHLEIDIFEYDFDKEKGYLIAEKDNISLLLMRLDKLSGLTDVIGNFIEKDDFELLSHNVSDDFWYNDIYKEFKSKFKPAKEYIDKMYNSKFMKYFYSEEEIKGYYDKYMKKDN